MKIISIIISGLLVLFTAFILIIWVSKGAEFYIGSVQNANEQIVFPERKNISVAQYYSQIPYFMQEHKISVKLKVSRNPFFFPLRQKIIYGGTKPM